MPIYEYKCPECGTAFEEWLKVSECENPQPCPNCKGEAHRIVSQTSFVLKGEGWYVTEYGKNSASTKKGESHSTPPAGASADPATSKTEAKAENTQTTTASTTTEKATSEAKASTTTQSATAN